MLLAYNYKDNGQPYCQKHQFCQPSKQAFDKCFFHKIICFQDTKTWNNSPYIQHNYRQESKAEGLYLSV